MARNTSGLWRGIADAVDPDGRPSHRRGASDPIDLTTPRTSDAPAATGPTFADGESTEAQGGQMLVPLDTWTRILEQVGHVHEAGQQLADAKERAARAETENRFLHEQLKELKAQRRPVRRSGPKPAPRAETPVGTHTPPGMVESRSIRARRQVSRWLSP